MKFTEGAFKEWGYDLARAGVQAGRWVSEGEEIAQGQVVAQGPHRGQHVPAGPACGPEEFAVLATPNLNGDYLERCPGRPGGRAGHGAQEPTSAIRGGGVRGHPRLGSQVRRPGQGQPRLGDPVREPCSWSIWAGRRRRKRSPPPCPGPSRPARSPMTWPARYPERARCPARVFAARVARATLARMFHSG